MRRIDLADLTRHPLAGRVEGEPFGVQTLIEDRAKGFPGGTYQDLRVAVGRDLATLDGPFSLIRVRGRNVGIRQVVLRDVPAELSMTLFEVSRTGIDNLMVEGVLLGADASSKPRSP
jgi:hypothetical protein